MKPLEFIDNLKKEDILYGLCAPPTTADKGLNISDVISRFDFRDGDIETENKIIRYIELRGMLRTNTMGFINSKEFRDNYSEMEELRKWVDQI
jgi:hypothetical protein